MRIFVYEYVTGGGWHHVSPDATPNAHLLAEARAMLQALATDLAALPECQVVALHDARLSPLALPANIEVRQVSGLKGEILAFEAAVRESDAVLLIAPEFSDHLTRRATEVESTNAPLISPHSEFIAIAADKWRIYAKWRDARVQTPESSLVRHGGELKRALPVPVVAKPVDGCGSMGMQLIPAGQRTIVWDDIPDIALVQEYCPGTSASVAVLCGPFRFQSLPGCFQHISDDGSFRYQGGAGPLPERLNRRAQILTHLAIKVMPPAIGYVGVDLILGEAEDGSQDYVIEINPRLTTSYVGLRMLSETNLAQAMLDVAQGREPQLAWKPGRVAWTADGVVEYFDA